VVKHGGTFTTVEHFEPVAKAIGECAFIESELPVVLSMEMHCTPKQQNYLMEMMVKHMGEMLMSVRAAAPDFSPATLLL
jgi:phosphatidylinositol phospholipase C, delta